jgi:ribokinase
MTVIGAINQDVTIFERKFGESGEEVPVLDVQEYPGGKGANVAVAASKIYGEEKVAFIGAVGDDAIGSELRDELLSRGVNVAGVFSLKGRKTGRAFILVDANGDKIIHTHFGANDSLLPSHLDSPYATAAVSSSSAVIIIDPPIDVALRAAELAKNSGARVVYSPGVRSSERKLLEPIVRLSDDLIIDRSELTKLVGAVPPTEALQSLSKKFTDLNIIATLGSEGSLVSSGGRVVKVPPVKLSSLGLTAVNSAGSGDAFLAAYVCYSIFGNAPEEAARWGNLAGALKAANQETRGSPSKEFLESKMAEIDSLRGRRQASPSNRA